MDGSLRVMKRNGSVEPFVFAKLLGCIRAGLDAQGEPAERGGTTARALAEAVRAYLEQTREDDPVSSAHLAELVELVLTQTGFTEASLAVREHARIRQQHRRWVRVAVKRGRDGHTVHKQWNKARVCEHLQSEHDLDLPASRLIASRVEQLIFNCGLKVVTAGLVKEMTRSELLAWGLLPDALIVKKRRTQRNAATVKDRSDPV